jgi:hypothetical protein
MVRVPISEHTARLHPRGCGWREKDRARGRSEGTRSPWRRSSAACSCCASRSRSSTRMRFVPIFSGADAMLIGSNTSRSPPAIGGRSSDQHHDRHRPPWQRPRLPPGMASSALLPRAPCLPVNVGIPSRCKATSSVAAGDGLDGINLVRCMWDYRGQFHTKSNQKYGLAAGMRMMTDLQVMFPTSNHLTLWELTFFFGCWYKRDFSSDWIHIKAAEPQ